MTTVNPHDAKLALAIADLLKDGNWLDQTVTVERPGAETFRVVRSADGVRMEFGEVAE